MVDAMTAPSPAPAPFLGVVVVNYGSHDLLADNLSAGFEAEAGARVYVVDNFLDAAERDAIGHLCDERGWTLVPLGENLGFGHGVNIGARHAFGDGADVVVTLNPDAVADPVTLRALADGVREDPMSVAAPLIVTSTGRPWFRGSQVSLRTGAIRGGWNPADDDVEWKNWLTGACLAFDRATFQATGGFDPDYFLYWEDVDFSRRAVEAGRHLVVREDLTVIHDEGGTHGDAPASNAKSALYYFHNTRNRLRFGRRFHSGNFGEWLAVTPRESLAIWRRGGHRQLITEPGGAVAAVRGALAGIRDTARGGLGPREEESEMDEGAATALGASESRAADYRGADATDEGGAGTVLIAHPYADMYGSDRVMLESVSALVEQGRRVVVTVPNEGPLVPALRERGAEVRFAPDPVLRRSYLSPAGLVRLGRDAAVAYRAQSELVRDVAPSSIIVNTVTIPLNLLIAKRRGIPSVVHSHEAEQSTPLPIRKGLYGPLLLADKLVTNSDFSVDVMGGTWKGLRDHAAIVRNGVPGPDEATPPQERLDGQLHLLFVGRISPRKGPQVAIDAVELLAARGIDVRLDLLGAVFPGYEWFDQELRADVEEHGLADRVRFLGFDADIWGHIAAHDIVLVPSIDVESFGNTAVEAILGMRPLVVSDHSGLREAADGYRNAWRIPPDDPEALADAVADIAANWAAVTGRAAADRELAMSRHAPAVYRQAFAAQIEAVEQEHARRRTP